MAAEVVKTLRSSGGDYSLGSAFEAGQQRDLVAADEIAVCECYDDWASGLDDSVLVSGWTVDATRYVVFRAASGHERVSASSGFYFTNGGAAKYPMATAHPYLRLESVGLKNGNASFGAIRCTAAAATNLTIAKCIIETAFRGVADHRGTDTFERVWFRSTAGTPTDQSLFPYGGSASGTSVKNCLATGFNYGFRTYTNHTYTNCVGYGCTSDWSIFQTASGDYNAGATGGTPPGANSISDLVSTDFRDTATEDYRPALGVDARLSGGHGSDLGVGSTTYGIDGVTFSSTAGQERWPIGPYRGTVESVHTIASSGGDYTTPTAWEAAQQGVLTTLDEDHVGSVSGSVTESSQFVIDGSTTDSTRRMILRAATGQEYDGNPVGSPAGISFSYSGGGGAIYTRDDYSRFEALKTDITTGKAFLMGAAGIVMDACWMPNGGMQFEAAGTDFVAKRSSIKAVSANASVTTKPLFINCIITGFADAHNYGMESYNTYCLDWKSTGTGTHTGDYNAAPSTSSLSAPGTNSIQTVVETNDFRDSANDDYYLAENSVLKFAGTPRTSDLTNDVKGKPWSAQASWSIGFDRTPVVVTKTIIATGGDYTTFEAWEAAEQGDLVSLDEQHKGEVSGTITSVNFLNLGGSTTDVTRCRKLVAAAGEEFNGDVSGSFATVESTKSGGGVGITLAENYAQVSGVKLQHTQTNTSFRVTGTSVFLDRTWVNGGSSDVVSDLKGETTILARSLFTGSGNNTLNASYTAFTVPPTAINCVIAGTFRALGVSEIVGYNTHATTWKSQSGGILSGDYNSSTNLTAPGANSIHSIVEANEFRDSANDDYRLLETDTGYSASQLCGAGTDQSSYLTLDVEGDTIAGWPIGFDYAIHDVIKSITTSGGDYTAIAAYEAAAQGNLISLDERHVGEVSGTLATVSSAEDDLNGSTTDATRYMLLKAASGEEFNGNPLGTFATAPYNLTTRCIKLSDDYASLQGFVITNSGGQGVVDAGEFNTGSVIDRMWLHSTSATSGASIAATYSEELIIKRTLVTGSDTSLHRQYSSGGSHVVPLVLNCVFSGTVYCRFDPGYVEAYNTYAASWTDLTGTGIQGDYNASDDTTAPGANSIHNSVPANEFRDPTNDDYRLLETDTGYSASQLCGAGTDQSSYLTLDVEGDTIAGWPIGFDYVIHDVIKSIKTSGGDYTTAAAWESAQQGNLVSLDERHIGEVSGTVTEAGAVDINGSTTDSTRYVYLRAASGEGFNGNPSGGAAKIVGNTSNRAIDLTDDYTLIQGLHVSNSVSTGEIFRPVGNHITIDRCWADGPVSGTNIVGVGNGSSDVLIMRTLMTGGTSAFRCNLIDPVDNYPTLINCVSTLIRSGNSATDITVINCYGEVFTGTGWNASSDYNADTNGNAPGTNSIHYVTDTDEFQSPSTDDYRIKTSSQLLNAGTDKSAYLTTDVEGETITTWMIGFDYELAGTTYTAAAAITAAATTTAVAGITATATGALYASGTTAGVAGVQRMTGGAVSATTTLTGVSAASMGAAATTTAAASLTGAPAASVGAAATTTASASLTGAAGARRQGTAALDATVSLTGAPTAQLRGAGTAASLGSVAASPAALYVSSGALAADATVAGAAGARRQGTAALSAAGTVTGTAAMTAGAAGAADATADVLSSAAMTARAAGPLLGEVSASGAAAAQMQGAAAASGSAEASGAPSATMRATAAVQAQGDATSTARMTAGAAGVAAAEAAAAAAARMTAGAGATISATFTVSGTGALLATGSAAASIFAHGDVSGSAAVTVAATGALNAAATSAPLAGVIRQAAGGAYCAATVSAVWVRERAGAATAAASGNTNATAVKICRAATSVTAAAQATAQAAAVYGAGATIQPTVTVVASPYEVAGAVFFVSSDVIAAGVESAVIYAQQDPAVEIYKSSEGVSVPYAVEQTAVLSPQDRR